MEYLKLPKKSPIFISKRPEKKLPIPILLDIDVILMEFFVPSITCLLLGNIFSYTPVLCEKQEEKNEFCDKRQLTHTIMLSSI